MPLPPEIDQNIRKRFAELESEAERLLEIYLKIFYYSEYDEEFFQTQDEWAESSKYRSNLQKLRINLTNLLRMLFLKQPAFSHYFEVVKDGNIVALHGTIAGLKSDYESGMLRSIEEVIEASIVTDYLEQAERLLKGNKVGEYNHVSAAVLAGAILENGLRLLCGRQEPPIAINKPGGHPKTLSTLIDDLKKSGLFNELKAKQLRAWADIRNAAAHGRFDDFARIDVEQMVSGVRAFLTEYL